MKQEEKKMKPLKLKDCQKLGKKYFEGNVELLRIPDG